MIVIIKLLTYYLKHFTRHLYWLLNLGRIKGINTTTIAFPVVVEGRGKIELGRKAKLNKNAKLLIAKKASLNTGANTFFDSDIDIRIGKHGRLQVGNHFSIELSSRLFIANTWVFGDDVKIATHCAIFSREAGHDGVLTIDSETHIGDHTIIDVSENITIGKEVAIGPNCTIYTHDHDYNQPDKAAWKGGILKKPIIIEDGAWIGSGVTILPGVTIGKNAVVAAGSVVTKPIPEFTIWGGIPAKQIKSTNN